MLIKPDNSWTMRTLRTCLRKERTLQSTEFCFHGKEEFCIPTHPIENKIPLYRRKSVHSTRKMYHTKQRSSRLHGKSEEFKILSLHKCTLMERKFANLWFSVKIFPAPICPCFDAFPHRKWELFLFAFVGKRLHKHAHGVTKKVWGKEQANEVFRWNSYMWHVQRTRCTHTQKHIGRNYV